MTTSMSESKESSSLHYEAILRELDENVFDIYTVEKVLGTGSMGEVSRVKVKEERVGGSAFRKKSKGLFGLFGKSKKIGELKEKTPGHGYVYALKSIVLSRVNDSVFIKEMLNEITILKSLDHPNIVRLHEVYHYHSAIYLVLELCDGGDLFTRSPYSEREAANITHQLLSAVLYMHENGVVHRDLKYENIMFENTRPDAKIKVLDFGLAKKFQSTPKLMTQRVGTIYTMSPQVLQGVYSSQADLWSSGVIAYMLLSASKPFWDRRRRSMIDRIMRADYSLDGPCWENISNSAKDFVSKLLQLHPKERMNALQALEHEWIVNREQLADEKPSSDILATIDDNLVNYTQTSALKKIALNIIAHRSNPNEILELRKVFDSYDTTSDGVISFEEFKAALKKSNYSDESLVDIFAAIDINKNGRINYTEFIAAALEINGHITEDRIAVAFDRLDCDDNGYISKSDLKEFLGKDATKEEVDSLMAWADLDGDSKITYSEFLQAFRTKTHKVADELAHMESGSSAGDNNLVGIDAKIPGGIYDSHLDPELRKQLSL